MPNRHGALISLIMTAPLGRRGRQDVLIVAKHLSENELTPDLMISSTASRALNTALYIADDWGYPEEQIRLDESLFHATSEHLLECTFQYQGRRTPVAIVGCIIQGSLIWSITLQRTM